MANPLTYCKGCAYFQESRPDSRMGTCHYNAPVPLSGPTGRAVWPEVNGDIDWCADAGLLVSIPATIVAKKQTGKPIAPESPKQPDEDDEDPRH